MNLLILGEDIALVRTLKELDNVVIRQTTATDIALELFNEQTPSIVVVELTKKLGKNYLDFAHTIQEYSVGFIFISKYIDHAFYQSINALKSTVILNAPINKFALLSAIENLKMKFEYNFLNQYASEENIFIKTGTTIEKVRLLDIYAISSDGNYSEILTPDRKYLKRASLREMKEKFLPKGFIQINKSTIIQMQAIKNIDLEMNQVYVDNQVYAVSRNFRSKLIQKLDLL